MRFFDILRRLFGQSRSIEAIEAKPKALEKDQQALQALEQTGKFEDLKEPFQLGLAAGYTGRSIKEIESSLHRIESQMTTKDWFLSTFEDKSPTLVDLLRLHEEEEKKRFEVLSNLLASLQKTAEMAQQPKQPIKTEPISINVIKNQLPLTQKMEELILAVKEFGEISYQDLALKLGISVSGLRGLLTHTLRRTKQIGRFVKNSKGWVKYIGD